ncbi:MAG: precorrin-8X methylmutase [Actinobacteria bacterium]|nr:precorrin-8X methylmutase [Actinomycetota bacterium]
MRRVSTIHPIESESYRILRSRISLDHLAPADRAVVERVIHASADLDYAESLVVQEGAVEAGVEALRSGAPVIADVEMVRAGITGVGARCYLSEARPEGRLTRSAAAIRLAAQRHAEGAVVVVGCAPTALVEAVALVQAGAFRPALLIGLPVGFVGAAEAKEMARTCATPSITNVGEKGGSAVAAAALNALVRLQSRRGGDDHG